jgi:hypothetical protein
MGWENLFTIIALLYAEGVAAQQGQGWSCWSIMMMTITVEYVLYFFTVKKILHSLLFLVKCGSLQTLLIVLAPPALLFLSVLSLLHTLSAFCN